MSFDGLNPDALAFFDELAVHNTKDWWQTNKARYDTNVAGPFEALAEQLEPEFGPVKIFRPYRDVRFSADKSPYKLQIGLVTRASAAHYLQLSASGLLIGGGMYQPSPARLAAFRSLVDDPRTAPDLEATLAEVRAAGFEPMRENALRTAPRGFATDHPRIELLRLRHLAVGREEQPDEWMWTPVALDEIRAAWHVVSVWCDWLHTTIATDPDAR
ncbi:DUF2461 domain-containing protein [Microbacterium schleiferi]|uniref:DUF2461 domain-containing protein n=1 Tax=Microbacterium schleiferi TaxID=69362 RepID=UPI001E32E1DB|nr:DUF2461 domain-containing protein [Microbacterium schleiferi]